MLTALIVFCCVLFTVALACEVYRDVTWCRIAIENLHQRRHARRMEALQIKANPNSN